MFLLLLKMGIFKMVNVFYTLTLYNEALYRNSTKCILY